MRHVRSLLRPLSALPALIALLPLTLNASPAAPRLQFTTAARHQLAIKGTGWGPSARISFRFAQNATVQHLGLVATRNGSFVVGADQVDACADVVVSAHDPAKHRVTLRRPERACP